MLHIQTLLHQFIMISLASKSFVISECLKLKNHLPQYAATDVHSSMATKDSSLQKYILKDPQNGQKREEAREGTEVGEQRHTSITTNTTRNRSNPLFVVCLCITDCGRC